jgi:hypothetical protein
MLGMANIAACSDAAGPTLTNMPTAFGEVSKAAGKLDAVAAVSTDLKFVAKSKLMDGIFVADYNGLKTYLFALPNMRNGPPVCTTNTSTVNGIGVDASGTLWVPEGDRKNVVKTYEKGTCKRGALTLVKPGSWPDDVAFSRAGTVYVADFFDPGQIAVYNRGASTPIAFLTDPSIPLGCGEADGVAVDKDDNVFLSSYNECTQGTSVLEFQKGQMPGTVLAISGIKYASGLEFDASNNLIVVDPFADQIDIFAPPYQGPPILAFPTKGSSWYGKLDQSNANFYASDNSNRTIDVFAYPSGAYEYSISEGLSGAENLLGIAVYPAAPN